MNKFYIIIATFLMALSTFAQAPEKMSYQAVIRNSSDALITNQAVGMQISILQTTATGTAVYVETQTPITNVNGLVSLEIGTGTPVTGTFAGIDWATGPYFIKTETDPTGSTTYTITGTSQLMSVPYALHAKIAEYAINDDVNDADFDPTNEIELPTGGTDGDVLKIVGGQVVWYSEPTPPNNVQNRLDGGETPLSIYNSDNSLLDSLYGKSYQGGLIFYINTSSGAGLIVADFEFTAGWGCNGTLLIGADGTAIGTGLQNTNSIVAECSTSSAAHSCANLFSGGYDDWFLPSKDELNEIYQHKNFLGYFGLSWYWSSTQSSDIYAWDQTFFDGSQYPDAKNARIGVRAVRAF